MEGGTALAKLLFGEVSPSGKLPFTVTRSVDDYPHFDRDADAIAYGYYHGYALLDRDGKTPRFPFGHGLSYARFSYRALKARVAGGRIEASVAVRNDGDCTADEVAQLYFGAPGISAERHKKNLKAFARVTLDAGQTRIVRLTVLLADLRWRDPATHGWKLESGTYRVMVGGSSTDLIETKVQL
jgi:beta-glucosidase